MKLSNIKPIFSALAVIACMFFMSCQDNESTTGKISLSITDAPLDKGNIQGVHLSIVEIEVKGENGWQVLETFDDPVSINLLDYQNGNSLLLTENTLDAGSYSEIRLILDIAEHEGGDASNNNTYLEFADGSIEPLFVPSGASSGYKAKGNFTIPAGGVVGLTIDFNARKSVVEAGNSGKFILKPVLRLVEDSDVGIIEGEIETTNEYGSLVVFAYSDGTFQETEADLGVDFENSITSATITEEGEFLIGFMDSGTYDLVFASYDSEGNLLEIVKIEEDIVVNSGEIREVEISL